MSTAGNSGRSPAVGRAIEAYHQLLLGAPGLETLHALDAELRRTDLVFGDRPICRVARPYFLAESEANALARGIEVLMRAFRKVYRALHDAPEIRAVLRLAPEDEAILAIDRQPFEPDTIARIDGFLAPDGRFRVIEYNAESPGGIAFGDTLSAIFKTLPIWPAFARRFPTRTYDGLGNTLHELLSAHRAGLGREEVGHPTIGVVDWRTAPTRREFEICAERFSNEGYPSRVIDPSELSFDGHRLRAGDFEIDIVYKRVLVKDLLANGGMRHPLVQALKAGAITCASGFGVHLLYRKELFALLHDPRLRPRFDSEESDAIRRLVPWSQIVRDGECTHPDGATNLREFVRANRTRLVLKPTAEYGGTGVVLGWLVDQTTWERAYEAALLDTSLVQERVTLGREVFPQREGEALAFRDFYADINPYIWGGTRSEGFGCRLAAGELLNVTAGGGSAVPVFVLQDA